MNEGYSRFGKEFSNDSETNKLEIREKDDDNEPLINSKSENNNDKIKEEYEDKLQTFHNDSNIKIVSVQQNDLKQKEKNSIFNALYEMTTKKSTAKNSIQENITLKIFNIKKANKVRRFEMRTQYIINFFKYLQIFIQILMKKFNESRENEEDKIMPIYKIQPSKIFIKYNSKEAYNSFCLNKTAREILSINDKEKKNLININIFNKVMRAEGNKKNKELIEVLNKHIKQLMDIYRDKKKHKDDFYKDFTRFEDYLNKLRQEEDADCKKINIIEQEGINYESNLKYNVENECRHGPKPKNKIF